MYKIKKLLFSFICVLQACQISTPTPIPSSTQSSSAPEEVKPSIIQSQSAIPSAIPSVVDNTSVVPLKLDTLIKINFKNYSPENLFVLLNNKGYGFIFKGIYAKYVENFKATEEEVTFTKDTNNTYITGFLNDEGNGLIAWDTGFSGKCSASNVFSKQIVNYNFLDKNYLLAERVCLPYPQVKLDSKGNGEIQWDKNDEGNNTITKFIKKINKFIPSDLDPEKMQPITSDNTLFITKPIKVINSSGNGYMVTTANKMITLKRIRSNVIDTEDKILYKYKNYGSPASIYINEAGDGMVVWSDFLTEDNNANNLKEQVYSRLIKTYQVL